jgi:type IV pilus biogenesis protein CpaD/CtpE
MIKSIIFAVALGSLAGCATTPASTVRIVSDSEEARQAVAFCDVARPAWFEPVDGDPTRTQAQKAAGRAAIDTLECAAE